MKKSAMLMLCLVLVFALAACAGTDTTPQGSVSDTVTVTDMKGEVAIPANPQRIVDVAGLTEELLILDMKVIASANTSMFDGMSVPKHLTTLFAERGIEVVGNYSGSSSTGDLNLEKIAEKHPGMRLCLRFNPDVCDGDNVKTMTGGDLTKFGILLEAVEEVKQIVRRGNLKVVGLHEHTGSGLQRCESVYRSMENLMAIAVPENFPDLEFLDFGGGFKVPYKPDEARIDYVAMGAEITRLFEAFTRRYGRRLNMLFEPGKYIFAEAGVLLTEVNTIKHNRTRVIAGCDSGFPQLIRPVLYDAYHQVRNLSNPDGKPQIYDVCGNICETGDRFAEQRELPEIREYDILAIGNAGAYCYSMGGVYNLRAMPTEVVVSGGKVTYVRERLTSEQLCGRILGEGRFL